MSTFKTQQMLLLYPKRLYDRQGMQWNGMENGKEWKENFGMEYEKCLEWNEMEDLKNGMEDRLPY